MKAIEFERGLNSLIVGALQSVESGEIKPQDIVFMLEMQKLQACQFFLMRAAAAQQNGGGGGIIIPRKGPIPPSG